MQNFEYGDKVLFRDFSSNRKSIPYISCIQHEDYYRPIWGGGKVHVVSDCTLKFENGDRFDTTFDEIYKPDERTIELFGKNKWQVEGVKQNNGYFGSYSLIEYKGKKAIVFCDDRDAIVQVVTDWYDDIFYKDSPWSGDYRCNHDMPVIVYDKEKGYALNKPHVNELVTPFIEKMEGAWRNDRNLKEYVINGIRDGKEVYVTKMGAIFNKQNADTTDFSAQIEDLKTWSVEKIKCEWIDKDKPCAYIKGLEYKGARRMCVDKEVAHKLIQTHNAFDCVFNSAEWVMHNGQPTLLFRDYCNSDYD